MAAVTTASTCSVLKHTGVCFTLNLNSSVYLPFGLYCIMALGGRTAVQREMCLIRHHAAACCKRALADHVRGLLSLTSRVVRISQMSLQVGAADIRTKSNVFRFSRAGGASL